jgi:hypothetical protein
VLPRAIAVANIVEYLGNFMSTHGVSNFKHGPFSFFLARQPAGFGIRVGQPRASGFGMSFTVVPAELRSKTQAWDDLVESPWVEDTIGFITTNLGPIQASARAEMKLPQGETGGQDVPFD